MTSSTIVLAEPHPLARRALALLLEDDPGLEVLAFGDLPDALRAVARSHAPVLLVSRRLLSRDGSGMLLPGPLPSGTRTIILGLEDNPAYAAEARRVGAAGYVVKDRADVELPPAIHALLDGPLVRNLPLSA